MNSPDSLPANGGQTPSKQATLLEELRLIPRKSFSTYWPAALGAILFGYVAWMQGGQFATIYFGLLTVIISMDNTSERRTQRQIDLVVELIREIQNDKNGNKQLIAK